MAKNLTDIFLQLFCEKNSDGTKNLRLKGRDLYQRIKRRINDADMEQIAGFLVAHPEIVKLDLCYNDIKDKGLAQLVLRYLRFENNLQYLNLIGCDLTGKAMRYFWKCGKTFKLTTLRVNGNKLGIEGAQNLSKLLEQNSTLKHLDLGDSDQTLSSIPYLCSVLREDIGANRTLQVLDISRLIPTSEYYQYDPGHLAEQLGNMLKAKLHVQKCQFDGHDIELLLIGMQLNNTLMLLDLGYNKIGDHGIEEIAKWLRTKPNLVGLNVSGNAIGNTGARALSFHMPFSKIRLLDISHNKIGDDGIIDILNSLKKPYALKLFYIWGNDIKQKTFWVLERMLLSKVLDQENIDIKLYTVDGVLYHAYYPSDHYKHKYYCVMDHGCPIELRIKRNKVEHEHAQPRSLVKFQFYPRIPPVNETLKPKDKPC
ncbi:leucine-rich repeat-containing protein 34 [Holotrichia oblita]|uniref:Leucine-rich repeat-containing protein 34 n=1 Tax=Holotrichia oblita TaxID=644536 RepID=A0ACB9TG93_HOLOL|nr:leucine-rich repeat-containing protein 34 [Holotrichia oblita]